MRTTLDLPDGLVAQVREVSNLRTDRSAMIVALDEFVKSRLRARLVARLGRTQLRITRHDVEAMREDDDEPTSAERMRLMLPPQGGYPCIGRGRPTRDGS